MRWIFATAIGVLGLGMAQSNLNLNNLTVVAAAKAIQSKQISSTQLTEALLGRIEAQRGLNAMTYVDRKGALEAAQKADQALSEGKTLGPLHGVPLIIKDNIHVAGMPNTAGTPALKGFVPSEDAPVVKALRAAGAIILGKSNLHELAFGITSNNTAFGAVRNPFDPSRFAGGSSGGSAAAVAAGMAPAALGTDTGGSIRIPPALNGLVGLRPSAKRYPQDGITPISSTRDTAGPMARTVEDVALLDSLITGTTAPLPTLELKGVRLGIYRAYFFQNIDAETLKLTEAALAKLQSAGAVLVEVEMPQLADLNSKVGFPIALFEGKRDLIAYLSRYKVGLSIEQVAAQVASPDVKGLMDTAILGPQAIPEAVYNDAIQLYRPQLQALYAETFQKHNLAALVFPTTPLPAQPVEGSDQNVMLNGKAAPTFPTFIQNTDPGSNAGLPGLTLPMALTAAGLPLGLELDGPSGSDRNLLALGAAIEKALGVRLSPKP